jgi:hypothetical protein
MKKNPDSSNPLHTQKNWIGISPLDWENKKDINRYIINNETISESLVSLSSVPINSSILLSKTSRLIRPDGWKCRFRIAYSCFHFLLYFTLSPFTPRPKTKAMSSEVKEINLTLNLKHFYLISQRRRIWVINGWFVSMCREKV